MTINTVFIHYANLDNIDLNRIKSSIMLPKQLLIDAELLPAKRAKQFLACRYLLAQIMSQQFNRSQLPEIVIGDNQRPHFVMPQLPDFNISHSGNYIAVGVASVGKLGVDIEQHRDRKHYLNIAQQFFSIAENNWLSQQINPLDAFWQLWTMREAALKLYAKGVWQMKQMSINMKNKQIEAEFAKHFHCCYQRYADLHLSLCSDLAVNDYVITEIVIN